MSSCEELSRESQRYNAEPTENAERSQDDPWNSLDLLKNWPKQEVSGIWARIPGGERFPMRNYREIRREDWDHISAFPPAIDSLKSPYLSTDFLYSFMQNLSVLRVMWYKEKPYSKLPSHGC